MRIGLKVNGFEMSMTLKCQRQNDVMEFKITQSRVEKSDECCVFNKQPFSIVIV
ncbi:MAG: hypothetical protein RL060_1879 [Bacteroidota bacterium]